MTQEGGNYQSFLHNCASVAPPSLQAEEEAAALRGGGEDEATAQPPGLKKCCIFSFCELEAAALIRAALQIMFRRKKTECKLLNSGELSHSVASSRGLFLRLCNEYF